ncbi:SulP family sulfate permease [Nonlabens dokdonensis]|uniref:Sulfate permease n=2 Tax=Nonlabens dokdonensis TaxID=328515 RepID=L7WBE4_NONDD|nr:SulP family inorganic anion transporter [Nonlabens dokdonensis]AGC77532.1 sulfate permease [Nonlabens dokdonensis DSW-6]PZX39913.1 SulP family sulfate permease [Nonlabens dokdonensis]
MSKLFNNFVGNLKNDLLSGLTVALALVPEAVAFAFVAGIDPMVGLYGAFMMGLITSLFGGRPGMISGATGAMAVVMVHMIAVGNEVGNELAQPIENLGLQWLFITLLIVGAIQISAGLFKLGKFVRLIPHPVMMGFVNGLAIVIFLAQLGLFPQISEMGMFEQNTTFWDDLFANTAFWTMSAFVLLTMAIMFFLPKLTKAIPSALVAIVVVAAITISLGIDVDTVGSFLKSKGGADATLEGSLPTFQYQIFSLIETIKGNWMLILGSAVTLAAVGLIESLMTLNLVDDLTETRGSGNRECVAQGAGNMINGLFGGMGGCAMIGQSIINVNSGGRGRLSGVVASVALLLFILFGAPVIEQIPIAALVGVMFMVVIGTFAWSSFRIINKVPVSDIIVLISVSAITVIADLAIAVVTGVIMSALIFAWNSAKRIRARKSFKEDGTKVYEIWGPLFFGSVTDFNNKFDPKSDPDMIEIDFIESRVQDHSGIEALRGVANKYLDLGKKIKLTHLSPECKELLMRNNPEFDTIIESSIEDPRYHIATDLMDAEV